MDGQGEDLTPIAFRRTPGGDRRSYAPALGIRSDPYGTTR